MQKWVGKIFKGLAISAGIFGIYKLASFGSEAYAFSQQAKYNIGIPKNIKLNGANLQFTLPLNIVNPTRFFWSINFPKCILMYEGNQIGETLNSTSERIQIIKDGTKTIDINLQIDLMANLPIFLKILKDSINAENSDNQKLFDRVKDNFVEISKKFTLNCSLRVLGININKNIPLI